MTYLQQIIRQTQRCHAEPLTPAQQLSINLQKVEMLIEKKHGQRKLNLQSIEAAQ